MCMQLLSDLHSNLRSSENHLYVQLQLFVGITQPRSHSTPSFFLSHTVPGSSPAFCRILYSIQQKAEEGPGNEARITTHSLQ